MKNHSQNYNCSLSLNTGLQDLSSISLSSITYLQVDVPDEAIVLDQSNISIEEMNLISQDNSNKLSLSSKVVLSFFSRYNLTNIFYHLLFSGNIMPTRATENNKKEVPYKSIYIQCYPNLMLE